METVLKIFLNTQEKQILKPYKKYLPWKSHSSHSVRKQKYTIYTAQPLQLFEVCQELLIN